MATVTVKFTSSNNKVVFNIDKLKVHVPPHKTETITWKLAPSSTSGAKFDTANGIELKPGGPPWTPTVPFRVSDDEWQGTLQNALVHGNAPQLFRYSVSIVFNGVTYEWDPDVQNDPPPPPPPEDEEEEHGRH